MATTTTDQFKASVREALDRIWREGDLSFVDENFAEDYVLHEPNHPEDIH